MSDVSTEVVARLTQASVAGGETLNETYGTPSKYGAVDDGNLGAPSRIRITGEFTLKSGKYVVRGSYHQGDCVFAEFSRGRQCTAMAAAAIAAVHVLHPSTWTEDTVDNILFAGDNLFHSAVINRRPVNIAERDAQYLTPEELPDVVDVLSARCNITLKTEVFGHLWFSSEETGFPNLESAIVSFFNDVTNNNGPCSPAAIFTCNGMSVALFGLDGLVWMFDSHSRDELGKSIHDGKACLIGFLQVDALLQTLMINIPKSDAADAYGNQYMLTPVTIDATSLIAENSEETNEYGRAYSESILYEEEDSADNFTTPQAESITRSEIVSSVGGNEQQCTSEHMSVDDEQSITEELQLCEEQLHVEAHSLIRRSSPLEEFKTEDLSGRGIYSFGYVWKQLHESFDNHSPISCGFENIGLSSIRRAGLKSILRFKCSVCNFEQNIWSEPPDDSELDVNTAMVLGAVVNGIGFFQAESLLAAMDIRCMAESTYQRYHESVVAGLTETAYLEMKKAGEEERELAIARGDIINGVPHIRVIADGSWMKRSYQSGKFDSPSGTGAIVGEQTGKVLFIGLKNKFCSVCDVASSRNIQPRQHTCYKNWGSNQSSSSMEAHAIAEGFNCSIEQHGLIYSVLIADGDSSVFNRISELAPYRDHDVHVKKIECRNHMFRSARRNLMKIVNTGKLGTMKRVLKSNIENIIHYMRTAIQHRLDEASSWPEKKVKLREDILNIPSHVFGEHGKCLGTGYCRNRIPNDEVNYVMTFRNMGKFDDILDCVRRLADNADSFLYGVNNNAVESFHNIIAKFIGGKRVHWGKRGSYNARVSGAAVQCNTNSVMTAFSTAAGKKPSEVIVALEERRAHLNELRQRRMDNQKENPKKVVCRTTGPDKDYGPQAEKPDLDDDTYSAEYARLVAKLMELQKTSEELERDTLLQSDSMLWQSVRRKLLTASNFGAVCHMRDYTSCSNIVRRIVYPPEIGHMPSIRWGKENEEVARQTLEQYLSCVIEPCGLFVDPEILGLGASPDGLIGDNAIVEIKCPYAARFNTISEAINLKKGNIQRIFVKNDVTKAYDTTQVNPKHLYYYQVQGQLHVTRRQYCYFMLWTPQDFVVVEVEKDDNFWKNQMEAALINFYQNCMIPEIVDPRYIRSMPIRNPPYILEAMAKRETPESMKIDEVDEIDVDDS